MNITYPVICQIEVPLRALDEHLWRFRDALRQHLCSLVQLVGDHRVGAVSRTCNILLSLIIVIIMSIKVWPLLVSRTSEVWLLLAKSLVVQVIELLTDSEDVLRLLSNHVLAFAIGGIEHR